MNFVNVIKSSILFNMNYLLKYRSLLQVFLLILILFFFDGCNKQTDANYINEQLDRSEILRLQGNKEELIALNNKIIKSSKKKNYKKEEALGYINLSNIYGTIGDYKLSQYYLKLASQIAGQLKDNFLNARLYHEYGQMNYALGLYRAALNYNAKAIYYGKKLDEKGWLLGNTYVQRADFILDKNTDSAFIYFHKGFNMDRSALNSSLIGNYHLEQTKNLDSASFYINKARTLLKKQEHGTVREGVVYYYFAQLLFAQKKYTEALEFYEKSFSVLKATKRINKLPDLYQKLALTYQKLNNNEKENEYILKYNNLNDSLRKSGNEAIDISVVEGIQRKEADKYKINNTVLFSGIFILLTGSFFLLLKYIKARKESQKEVISETLDKELLEKNDMVPNQFSEELFDLIKTDDVKFLNRFEEIYPEFFKTLLQINPQLTQSEFLFCAVIRLGFSSKDIAELLFMQHRSVQTKKGRLRKKLNVSSEIDLYIFLKSL